MAGRSQRHLREIYGRDSLDGAPRRNTLPTVAGTATVGQTLTGTNGTFTGMGTITVTRAWLRDGTPIPGATGATYVLVSADAGKRIRFRNIATSQHGHNYADSNPTDVVAAS